MKKIFFSLAVVGLSLTYPAQAQVKSDDKPKTEQVNKAELEAEAAALVERLKEIDRMDKSDLSRAEKKELRKEVKAIEKRLHEVGGVVYISVGALILLIVLLIILL